MDVFAFFRKRKRIRGATRGDWVTLKKKNNGTFDLVVEKTNESVRFLNYQVIEVHRLVIRHEGDNPENKLIERFEIEESVFFLDDAEGAPDGRFFFQYFREFVNLKDLPDKTIFIATDRKVPGPKKRKRRKLKSRIAQWLDTFEPFPDLVPLRT